MCNRIGDNFNYWRHMISWQFACKSTFEFKQQLLSNCAIIYQEVRKKIFQIGEYIDELNLKDVYSITIYRFSNMEKGAIVLLADLEIKY